MKYSKLVIHSVLLFTVSSIALYAQNNSPQVISQVQKVSLEEQPMRSSYIPSYDEIIRLFDDIESEELEKRCSLEELEKIKHFIAFLAKTGALPDDSEESLSLDDDIKELLNTDDNPYGNGFSFGAHGHYQHMIIPAMMALGEDVGLTMREMAQLKQAGKLEGAINSSLEKLVFQSESEVLKTTLSQNKHVKMVKDYLDKPAKEIQKGVNSYEKQIIILKDKIANPTKYYPDWNKLDPRQREALINKKWPAEIKGYEEQKSVLQSILNERLSYES